MAPNSSFTARSTANNIVLIGFMGTGKSSLGKRLAQTLGWPLLDTDSLIERKAGRTITEIFATEGETAFRDLETSILESLKETFHAVISTGGGIVMRPENRALLKKLGLVVWLTADESVIFNRVSRNSSRPLLQTEDPRKTLRDLLEKRDSIYSEIADIKLDTGNVTPGRAIVTIAEAARNFLGKQRQE